MNPPSLDQALLQVDEVEGLAEDHNNRLLGNTLACPSLYTSACGFCSSDPGAGGRGGGAGGGTTTSQLLQ